MQKIIDFLFPPLCATCKKLLQSTEKKNLLCDYCRGKIIINKNYFLLEKNVVLSPACSYVEKSVKDLIYLLKYNSIINAAIPLSSLIIEHMRHSGLINKILSEDKVIIIPVPLHRLKKAQRGYNQSEEIANEIGNQLRIPVCSKTLKRIYYTKPQAKAKNEKEREENIKDCFKLTHKKKFLRGWTVILIDDVYTTGNTVKEVVEILKSAHPKQIIISVVAVAKK